MSYTNTIWLNQQQVIANTIASHANLDPYERDVLAFINEWENGSTSFTLHTSGSTGKPKPITVKRSQMIASAQATVAYLNLPLQTPVTVCIDARYIGGKMQIIRALTHNLPLQIISPKSQLKDEFDRMPSLGLLSLVPMQLYSLLDKNPKLLNKASAILIGGAPIQSAYLPKIQTISSPVYHTYGMTETISHIALKQLNSAAASDEFQLLPSNKIWQDDRTCLVVTGLVTDGKEVVTNDIIELISPFSFRWKGRYDNVVNSGGIKISPEEVDMLIETAMQMLFPGQQYFTAGIPDDKFGQKLILVVEGNHIEKTDNVLLTLKKILPAYHSPKLLYFSEAFAKTASGKLDKIKTVDSVLS